MHLPQEVIEQGYIGKINAMQNACTITLLRPGAPLEETINSLQIAIKDLKLRVRLGEKNDPEKTYVFATALNKDKKFPRRFMDSRVLIETRKGRKLRVIIAGVKKDRFILQSGKYIRFKNIKRIERY